MEIGERLNLQEIETASSRFKVCPKCNSREGFWLGLKRDHVYVQCKGCGARFELFEVYKIGEKGKAAPERLKLFRK
jgi:transcription elongation factor Elf1